MCHEKKLSRPGGGRDRSSHQGIDAKVLVRPSAQRDARGEKLVVYGPESDDK